MESYDVLSQDQTKCKSIYQSYKSAKYKIDAKETGTIIDGALISQRLQSATQLLMITAKMGDYCGISWVLDDLHNSFLLKCYLATEELGPVMAAIENGHTNTVKLFLLLSSWSVTEEMVTTARLSMRQETIDFLVDWKERPRVLEDADRTRIRAGWNYWRLGMSFRDGLGWRDDAA
ncbi:NAD(P)-binding domain protein [Metarhizium robertsii ARSEF 23]|nr:NAD(P)-binding domain protein [Metarhizium robertsii ARSEF 23]KHO11081.1 NAD(P)-binding domain protein [Metarhizium robertsii ARSEF 23]